MTQEELLQIIDEAARDEGDTLELSGEGLTALPPEIGQLQNLQELYLPRNQLTTLLPELGHLRKLKKLELEDNPLPEPYPDLIKRGTEALLTYLRSLQKESTPQYEPKLLLLGEGNAYPFSKHQ